MTCRITCRPGSGPAGAHQPITEDSAMDFQEIGKDVDGKVEELEVEAKSWITRPVPAWTLGVAVVFGLAVGWLL